MARPTGYQSLALAPAATFSKRPGRRNVRALAPVTTSQPFHFAKLAKIGFALYVAQAATGAVIGFTLPILNALGVF